MLIECIQRHLAVCAQIDLPGIAKRDPGFWNVVSIREPFRPPIQKLGFKQTYSLVCYDAITQDTTHFEGTTGIPRREYLEGIYQFVDTVAGEPILIHCWAGISRSTAVALSLIAREMNADGFMMEEIQKEAPEILVAIRPQAAPNPLLLDLGLATFLSAEEARQLTIAWVNHPILFANRLRAEPMATG